MRHYVVVFLESALFPGIWVTDHFVREAEREDIPDLPKFLGTGHAETIATLKDWQNVNPPIPSWTLEECLLGRVARFTALWFNSQKVPRRIVQYQLRTLQ